MSPIYAGLVLLTIITSAMAGPIDAQRTRWLEAMGLADAPGIYVGSGPVDMEISGDLPFGLEGSADQPPIRNEENDFDITDLLIAVDTRRDEESFIPSSSSSVSSIVEASVSEYDGIDSDTDIEIAEPTSEKYEGENELGMGDHDLESDGGDAVSIMPVNPNAIPDAFQNGAFAETGPEGDMTINHVSTKNKLNTEEANLSHKEAAVEGQKSSMSGEGKSAPNVMKYTAVIGVVMVAGAVGLGALLSAVGLGLVKLVKKARKRNVVAA